MYSPDFHISHKLLDLIAQIETVRTKISMSRLLPEREIAMRYRATVEATHSSTSIEGNSLTIKQVEQTLSNTPSLTRRQYAEIEVHNYKGALDYIEKHGATTKTVSVEEVLTIHKIITKGLLDPTKSGKWRTNPVYIEDQEGHTVYDAAEPKLVEVEVKHLLYWLNKQATAIHPVIASAIFHVHFLSIHPFADGNGRTTRALTMLYLASRNYDFKNSLVLDSYYSLNKGEYYNTLNKVQGADYKTAKCANLDSWIEYFAEGFLVSANVLAAEVTLLSSVVRDFSHVRRLSREDADILSYVQQFGSITISEAEAILGNTSRRTLQRKLKRLVDVGHLVPDGVSRSTRYIAGKRE